MSKDDEKVLVVPADVIFKKSKWQGLKQDNLDYYLDLIKNNYKFLRRGDVETDPSWQQIIPYIVFSFKNNFLVFKYLPKAGEKRLVGSYHLGIGGHINLVDTNSGNNVLEDGMMREWNEEVDFRGNILEKKFIGLINDDSRPVEAVHLGLLYNFIGDSPEIYLRESEKMEGELVSFKDIEEYIKGEENIWAQIVYRDYLSKT